MPVLSSPEFASQDPSRERVDDDPIEPEGECRGLFQRVVFGYLRGITHGQLVLRDRGSTLRFGQAATDGPLGEIDVLNPRFYSAVVLGGALGAAEAYLCGYWQTPGLTQALRVFARNAEAMTRVETGVTRFLRPVRALVNRLKGNSRDGSRRNIAAHYDLSNSFFRLMLDPTMTYSSGYYPHPAASLEEASIEKYDRACRKLRLCARDHVLEIGTGWGGFAEHAAKNYGCRVTTTTISDAQHDYASERFRAAGLGGRIELRKQDYRDLSGRYDKLVSIEMIEAVGERRLPAFFGQCSRLLKPHGAMLLQSITIPDHRYNNYRRSVDFIQRYIFPGGFLPSPSAITRCLAAETDFRLLHWEDFGEHYARTLRDWAAKIEGSLDSVRSLGFDERFLRTWRYYLSYCEAGFWERQIGVSQILLTKPDSRLSLMQ